MKKLIPVVLIVLLAGCATKPSIRSSSPIDDDSIGIHLMLSGQSYNKPTWRQIGVNMLIFNNTPRPVWIFPKYTFYGVHDGKTVVLLQMEQPSDKGWHLSPYYNYSGFVNIPEPPTPGIWKIFVVMKHSPVVYSRYSKDHNPKPPYLNQVDQTDWTKAVMWDDKVKSNTIQVKFIKKK